uniref:Uncharacterized protein n=1 Tax=Ananas comosus var. bracteatus TaxID=296719 RepID=A0A6V7Q5S9_ANACO|nr:unnamed protein product [Ananas comosus var. bracteatus]
MVSKGTGEKSKLVRSLRLESQRFRLLIIVVGGFLVTLTFIVVSKPDAILSSSPSAAAAAANDSRSASTFQKSPLTELSETKMTMDFREISEDPQPDIMAEDDKPKWLRVKNVMTPIFEPTKSESRFDTVITLETNPLQNDDAADSIQPSSTTSIKLERKPLCDFSNFRTNVCEMDGGEIRVHPKSASIVYMESDDSKADEIYKIKPYPRKGDEFCLSHVY